MMPETYESEWNPNVYLSIMNQIKDLVVLMKVESENRFRYAMANQAAMEIDGFSEERLGKLIEEVHSKEYASSLIEIYSQVVNAKTPLTFEDEMTSPRGNIVGESIVTPIINEHEECEYLIVVARDITKRKQQEAKLEASHRFLESFLYDIPDGMIFFDMKGKVKKLNPSFTYLFGWEQTELLDRYPSDFGFHPEGYQGEFESISGRLLRNESIPLYRTKRRRKDGSIIDVSASYALIHQEDGKLVVGIYRDISKQIQAEKQVQKSEAKLRVIMDNMTDLIAVLDVAGVAQYASASHEKVLGLTEGRLQGKVVFEWVHPEDLPHVQARFKEMIVSKMPCLVEFRIKHQNGHYVWFEAKGTPIINEDEMIESIVVTSREITMRKRTEQMLRESEARYRLIAEHTMDLIYVLDVEGTLTYASPSNQVVLGLREHEMIGTPFHNLIHLEDRYSSHQNFQHVLQYKETCSYEVRMKNKYGDDLWFELKCVPTFDSHGAVENVVFVARDISARKQYEKKLEKLALYDTLTEVPNRRIFSEHLSKAKSRAKRQKQKFAVLYMDLDRFKWINDTMGHDVGDRLLRGFAERVQECIREEDRLYRLGGDEFTIILTDIHQPEDIAVIAERILEKLQRSWIIGEHEFIITSSIGISIYPEDGDDEDTLVKHADETLYQAKKGGKNQYQFYGAMKQG